ncbi:Glycosyltransferase involved in cell wall bisynthesis [Parasphingorhabdus marina DSM 22363]|uniref:Glycosyltransferase involved in cell wall bisynthesis n=1 Tax=Parasphingorhabdus marina DSM 22363 TaxID=1123272 RepID=A0A1N6GJX7_9SPHN|nr:glycosyltransferase [Parasphingorhabdus marina]SIO07814.1 Glycosyltransferase involved in cell wall bisynthesis [Parasphingorhabdus marina DSM 22363]
MTRPLRILTLSTLFPHAGAANFGIFVERQTAELNRRAEADVTVINPVGLPPWPLSKLSRYRDMVGLATHELWNGLRLFRPRFPLIPGMSGKSNPDRIYRAILPLVRQLHEENPFELIDAEFFYPDGPVAMRLSEQLDIPFSIKARGADIHHWGNQPGCQDQILAAADKAAGLLAVSCALKQDMIDLGMIGDRITVHYTGVDQSQFQPVNREKMKAEMGIAGPLLICTGALIPRKNQALIIKAMTAFPNARLILAGSGPEETNYRRLADRLGVAGQVQFMGNVPHQKLAALTAAADIAVLVSRSEGLANAWVEALACGTPIVISAAGGAKELLANPDAGRIVEENPDAIAEAIRSILASPPDQQAVRDTVSGFSWESNGDQLLAHFQRIDSDGRIGN